MKLLPANQFTVKVKPKSYVLNIVNGGGSGSLVFKAWVNGRQVFAKKINNQNLYFALAGGRTAKCVNYCPLVGLKFDPTLLHSTGNIIRVQALYDVTSMNTVLIQFFDTTDTEPVLKATATYPLSGTNKIDISTEYFDV